MDKSISYTMYHTCKRPFILRPQPWKEVDIIYIIARETLILTLSTLLIKTNVFKQQLHCPRYSTWARQSNTWMCFFNVFSGKHVRIERLWTYNFWNSLFIKKKFIVQLIFTIYMFTEQWRHEISKRKKWTKNTVVILTFQIFITLRMFFILRILPCVQEVITPFL